ncbi:MAG: aminotransferase class V-fold PLP-dependent enzyme [Candidatus Portnoybacteria bacterium]|nr:aminotransferase class V-fold PLP-dependent enzyme [Candidatus Portnoybacteria bacterium]
MKPYLDYASTTPINKEVLKEMEPYLKEEYGNPSSLHELGRKAKRAIDKARKRAAKFLSSDEEEIIFTGSASESNNTAIRGLVKGIKQEKIHIITTQIEHKAVLETCEDIESENIEVTYLPVNKEGLIKIDDLTASIKPETRLISVMYVNNEMGAIQPIKEIGKKIEEINKERKDKIYFHTDAVQAANWLDCNTKELKVDLLTLSSHKIYGPKGVGLLYIKKGTPIKPLITGGAQEWKLRAGTENVSGIVGMGKAIELIQKNTNKKIEFIKSKLIERVLKIPGSQLNTPKQSAPHIANFSFKGVEGEGLLILLDDKGIAVSTGSACTSVSLSPSHVLMAMGSSELEAHSSIRVSLGNQTTEEEIEYFLKILPESLKKLRRISGR